MFFAQLGYFNLKLLPAFQGLPGAENSTSKLVGLHAVVLNTVLAQLFV